MNPKRFAVWVILAIIAVIIIAFVEFLLYNYVMPDNYEFRDTLIPLGLLALSILPIIIFFGAAMFYLITSKRKKEQMEQEELLVYDVFVNES
ncbi:MAG TPA: hypothetical protein VMZ29_16280 [Candidatus Bathyarchaeia archaeon]|nr:hypothetical protein [Candidatus Bathyarchaeia archaeon]